jgi:hypothetical protein
MKRCGERRERVALDDIFQRGRSRQMT